MCNLAKNFSIFKLTIKKELLNKENEKKIIRRIPLTKERDLSPLPLPLRLGGLNVPQRRTEN